jgi:hypothetical protein
LSESANPEKPRGFSAIVLLMIAELIAVLWLTANAIMENSYGWYLEYITLLTLQIVSIAGVASSRKWGAVAALVSQGIYLEHVLYIIDDLLFYPENFADITDMVSFYFLAALSIVIAIIIIVYLFKWLVANKLK